VYDEGMGKREDILAATRDLIAEEGLQAFSFPKIFARAGVGSGTVYHYFSGKEVLISTLYRETSALMDHEVLMDYDPAASIKERFRLLMKNTVRFVQTRWKERAVLDACWHYPALAEEVHDRLPPFAEATFSLLADGREKGIFVALDPIMVSSMILGAIVALVQGHLGGKYALDESVVDQVIEGYWRALTSPPSVTNP